MAAAESGRSAALNNLLRRVEQVLAARWNAPVRLGAVERMSKPERRNQLLRVQITQGPPAAPPWVIVKQAQQSGYDPNDPNCWQAVGLFREWAALEFLAGRERAHQIGCPAFYGGDRQAGFFVMQDLTAGEDLDHVLTAGNAARAEHVLILLARTLGGMHAASMGCAEAYQQIRDRLGPGDHQRRREMAEHVRDFVPQLTGHCRQLGFDVADGLARDIETVAEAMENPGPFLSLTHADPCPDNCLLLDDQLFLIDFEFASFRHALLDGVYGRMRFPTCWCVRDLPEQVIEAMESAYRIELARGCAAAEDDPLYFAARAHASGYWVIENLEHMLAPALEYEQPMGTATNRQRLLTRLSAFIRDVTRTDHLPAMRETMTQLLASLRSRWRDNMPLYDAFRQPSLLSETVLQEFVAAVEAVDLVRVRQMLEQHQNLAKAKKSDSDQTPVLYVAVGLKNAELVRLLLEHGADWRVTTRSGWTVLSQACAAGTPEIVDLLLQRGADLNERDAWGSLPIYGATGNGAMLRFLLSKDAQLDLKTALDLGHLDIARQLLKDEPARARFRFGTGISLLHDLARQPGDHVEAMSLLVAAGADVNARTNWKATPLHVAAFNGQGRAVEFLLLHGALVNPRDNHGRTPLAVARGKGHARCVELLVAHGGVD
jgi:ankyrin repeat protein